MNVTHTPIGACDGLLRWRTGDQKTCGTPQELHSDADEMQYRDKSSVRALQEQLISACVRQFRPTSRKADLGEYLAVLEKVEQPMSARPWFIAAIRRVATYTLLATLTIGLAAPIWAGYLQWTGNLHTIEAGRVYRSAQMDELTLSEFIRSHGVKTILNLRGAQARQPWYEGERRVAARLNVTLIDLGLSAEREPDEATMQELARLMKTAAKPLLIHCNAGADRTGLASAIFEYADEGRSADEAGEQLSFRYGHFPWLGSRTAAMDLAFQRYVALSGMKRQRPEPGVHQTKILRRG